MKVGFIGLGVMGGPMAGHVLAAGHEVFVTTRRSPVPKKLLDGGANYLSTKREVARAADVIITMLPDTPDVESALFGPDGVSDGLESGKIVLDMSSICPIETRKFAERVSARNCEYVDAPVSGGEVGAKKATLTIMVGGDVNAFNRVHPILSAMGKNITLIGDVGAGQTAKVANQIMVALTIQAVGEGLLFAAKAGADPAKVRYALMGGFASSRILDVHGDRMLNRMFQPGFRIALHQKDLNLALDGARRLGLSLPGTALVQELFNGCVARGIQELDHSAVIQALEALADFHLSAADGLRRSVS